MQASPNATLFASTLLDPNNIKPMSVELLLEHLYLTQQEVAGDLCIRVTLLVRQQREDIGRSTA